MNVKVLILIKQYTARAILDSFSKLFQLFLNFLVISTIIFMCNKLLAKLQEKKEQIWYCCTKLIN